MLNRQVAINTCGIINYSVYMTDEIDNILEDIKILVTKYYEIKHKSKDFIPGKTKVNYAGRVFDEKELINAVNSSLEFWLTHGKYTRMFEKRLAEYVGVSHALLVNSGSSANLVAMSTLTSPKLKERRLIPGDEVITVAAGFPSTVYPIIQNNLIPVFIDVDIKTHNIDVDQLDNSISDHTKAIMIAHTLGNPFNIKRVLESVDDNNLWLIEDNCDALGSTYDNKKTGSFGHLSTYSFYPAHHITMGEGGAVLTDDKKLAKIAESFRDWGRDCYCPPGRSNTCGARFTQQLGQLPYGYDHKYVYSHIGYNLKATDIQASIGLAQLDKLDEFTVKRKYNYQLLKNGLKDFKQYLILPEATLSSDPSWFGFLITIKNNKFKRDALLNHLDRDKIETRNLFGGNLIKQPAFQNVKYRVHGSLKNTDIIMNNSFFVGVYPGMTKDMINHIINSFKTFFSNLLL